MKARTAPQNQAKLHWDRIQKDFVAVTPSYVPCQQNGGAMLALLIHREKFTSNGIFTGTMQDVHDAFLDLVERGVIVLPDPETIWADGLASMKLKFNRDSGAPDLDMWPVTSSWIQ